MGLKEFVTRRIIQIVALYFAIATMLFFLFRAAPGDPLAAYIGTGFTQEQAAQIRARFGLDQPVYVQYWKFMTNLVTFNFGLSYITGEPVWGIIKDRIWNTLVLMGTSVILAYLIGVPFGAYLAWNRGTKKERFGVVFALISRSAPVFWTGLLGIWLFSFRLGWLPAGSMSAPGVSYSSKLAQFTSPDFLRHLILPALVQAFYFYSLPALLMRNSMLEVMNEDFVDFAELKGISDFAVMIKHAARNALLPIVTAFAVAAGFAVGGSVVLETVFAWPGLGREMVRAVIANDYPVAQATFLILAGLVLVANFLADLAYGYLDPRITYD